jgi:ubiquitin-protein ligase E3 C
MKYFFKKICCSVCRALITFASYAQHYKGDLSDLELYFVILNNEYGEQSEEELLPGGRDMRVTDQNVIMFIHLVANHRLNYQVYS